MFYGYLCITLINLFILIVKMHDVILLNKRIFILSSHAIMIEPCSVQLVFTSLISLQSYRIVLMHNQAIRNSIMTLNLLQLGFIYKSHHVCVQAQQQTWQMKNEPQQKLREFINLLCQKGTKISQIIKERFMQDNLFSETFCYIF